MTAEPPNASFILVEDHRPAQKSKGLSESHRTYIIVRKQQAKSSFTIEFMTILSFPPPVLGGCSGHKLTHHKSHNSKCTHVTVTCHKFSKQSVPYC